MKKLLLTLFILSFLTSNAQDPCTANWLSTNGSQLVDTQGNVVRLSGVNWFGFETETNAPHGIWGGTRDFKSVLQQIKDLGFNCIRVPWHNRMLEAGKTANVNSGGQDPVSGASPMNEDEANLSPIELLDALVEWCQDNDLRIMLDSHSRDPGAFLTENLWYTDNFSEQRWIDDWVFLADRYKDFSAVAALDLNNEPHGNASWGSGNAATDWKMAAEACGNAILAVNPNVVIVVEGTAEYTKPNGEFTSTWWGGNLQGVRDFPVQLNVANKLMYSPHEYGPEVFQQSWFNDNNFPNNLENRWDEFFNFIVTDNTAPLIVGEFGIKENVPGSIADRWMTTFTNYIATNNLSYTYWCMNPNSGDTGGILADNWSSINNFKMDYLINAGILYPISPNCVNSLSTETFTTENSLTISPNPTSDILNIKSKIGIEAISVLDINGRIIHTQKINNLNKAYSLKVNDFASGLYILQVKTGNGNNVSKFVKE